MKRIDRRRYLHLLRLALSLLALVLLCGSDCGGGGDGGGGGGEDPPQPPPAGGGIAWTDPIGVGNVTAEAGCILGGGNLCRPDHTGIDIAAPQGSYVSAAAEGTVTVADSDPSVRGNYVEIEHRDANGDVYTSFYWHLDHTAGWVRPGAHAYTDSILAYSGQSGNAVGHPHLHFGIRRNGQLVDPLAYIPATAFTNNTDRRCGETTCDTACPCFDPAQPVCGSCPAAQPAPSPSGTGGLESLPLWLFAPGARSTPAAPPKPASPAAGTPDRSRVPPLWRWGNGAAARPRPLAGAYAITLTDTLPAAPAGLTRTPTVPRDVLGHSNALEAGGADYVDPATGQRQAAIVAFRTVGTAYAHDYGICSRFKAGRLVRVEPVSVAEEIGRSSPVYFWGARMDMDELSREYATVFAVYVDDAERSFTVDSHWLSSQYPEATSGSILTYQVWAATPELAGRLAAALLQGFAARGPLDFKNTAAPPRPRVYATRAVYRLDAAELTLKNAGSDPAALTVDAVAWRAAEPTSEVRFSFAPTVPPGTTVVRLPMPGILNAVLYLTDGAGFVDALYLADGQWYAFDDAASGGGSQAVLGTAPCLAPAGKASDRVLAGCGQLSGKVGPGGYAGIGRALDPPGRSAVDASGFGALTFYARGDGKTYRVALETRSVLAAGSADFHQATFTAGPEWRQFVLPLAAFRQRGLDPGKPVAFTGEDVRSVTWSAIGAPLASLDLQVDRVAFTRSVVIRDTSRLPDTGRFRAASPVTSRVTGDGLTAVDLLYSVDGGATYRRAPMARREGDLYGADIPPQPLESEVRYYVQAADGDGNLATDPPDAPAHAYRFQVSRHPALAVEDFADTDPANLVGSEAWLFRSAPAAGAIDADYEQGALRLSYDVTAPGSFAGYVEPLGKADLSRFTALTFRVRGGRGGERVKLGLHDATGREPKVSLGEYLPGGVTTAWQRAVVPLAAFAGLADRTHVERLVFAFEQGLGSGRGNLFLDDLRFEELAPSPPIVVASFDEPTGGDGVGGALSVETTGGARLTAAYDPAHRNGNAGAGYRLTYANVRGSAAAAWVAGLAGLDASRSATLSFSIAGERGGERPRLYLVSQTGGQERRAAVDVQRYGRVGRSLTRIAIPLTAFKGVDLAHLVALRLAFESGAGSGTVYLDDVRLSAP
jgi:peptidase M23-like protein/complex I intermediate-associated protein 30 (CIA30)